MKVILIGSGNTATVLGRKISATGHRVVQVISRDLQHAQALAVEFDCVYDSLLSATRRDADFCLLAVSDSALPEIVAKLNFDNTTLLHTAGMVSIKVLEPAASSFGVLYPLQSLRKESRPPDVIPLLVDGNSAQTISIVESFAREISADVHLAQDKTRRQLHLAATVANNFANHLWTLAEDFCRSGGVEFSWLEPLIHQSGQSIGRRSPRELQTGPAARGDEQTIALHLEMLENHPELKKIYEIFTQSIRHANK